MEQFHVEINTTKIDTSAIPEYVARNLARATIEAVKRFMATPGGREYLEAKAEEIRKQRERREIKC